MSNAAVAKRRRVLIDRLKGVLIESLQLPLAPEEISEDAPLFGIGMALDSIDALQFVVAVEEAFSCSLPSDGIWIYRSLNTLADHLESLPAVAA